VGFASGGVAPPRGASLSVAAGALASRGLGTAGYGATAKFRGGWCGFQHASVPVFRGETPAAGALENWISGFLDFWKTENGDHIGVPLIGLIC
jgi:hypothetical protein